nr:ribonuclease H-like domain, reverse transcriptase, RNA-dependent DNA polymerase [Tanacetum cinerariifolium]
MGFPVYQMDVKSAFLYGTIEEEVYVCQLPRFEDPEYPDKVYKVVKALYGLHQAPRAWSSGKSASTPIDAEKPLLKDSDGEDVDVNTYRSMIGSLMYLTSSRSDIMFAVKQKKDGIFISQDKYVAEILRKFELSEGKSACTPIDAEKPLLKDSDGEDVDVHTYRCKLRQKIYNWRMSIPWMQIDFLAMQTSST